MVGAWCVYPAMAWLPGSEELALWAQGRYLCGWIRSKRRPPTFPFRVEDSREIRKAVRFDVAVAPDQFDVKQLRWMQAQPEGRSC